MNIQFRSIGILHTCFKEKFGIPRQPNLVKAPGALVFHPEFAREEMVRELDGFSHIWLLFLFHDSLDAPTGKTPDSFGINTNWSPMVRPPRLGGNQKVGVFASRSPFRPNPIGMSPVRLESVETTENGPVLNLSGVDILDQTPILDIKPYTPYSDSIPDARHGFAKGPPKAALDVRFTVNALSQIRGREKDYPGLEAIITGMLEQDPRPAYRSEQETATDENRVFGTRIFDFDLKWSVQNNRVTVISLDD
ncbi:MAG: tRNA (N6-threonylcarbamoyladenosine(37)-N6)-methyltransferase TrmO [Desulfobacteraceae bacterium]|nr:MAG: tRNA (N6-threonylcarbamoyladenosine(37)-N6)-methyltransferase TrmO [Desulfobacteraceae bacterium]